MWTSSFEATPSYDANNIVAVGVYTSDHLSDGYIPVHMDSASDLADHLDALREQMSEATTGMWQMMAGWTREQMIETIQRRRERWQMSYHVVGQEVMDEFAPIVSQLTGT